MRLHELISEDTPKPLDSSSSVKLHAVEFNYDGQGNWVRAADNAKVPRNSEQHALLMGLKGFQPDGTTPKPARETSLLVKAANKFLGGPLGMASRNDPDAKILGKILGTLGDGIGRGLVGLAGAGAGAAVGGARLAKAGVNKLKQRNQTPQQSQQPQQELPPQQDYSAYSTSPANRGKLARSAMDRAYADNAKFDRNKKRQAQRAAKRAAKRGNAPQAAPKQAPQPQQAKAPEPDRTEELKLAIGGLTRAPYKYGKREAVNAVKTAAEKLRANGKELTVDALLQTALSGKA